MREFNSDDGFSFKFVGTNKTKIFCHSCECTFNTAQKTSFLQHKSEAKHVNNMELKSTRIQRGTVGGCFLAGPAKKSKASEVGRELCGAFVAANTSLRKLNNPILRYFLETTLGIVLPWSQLNARRTYSKILEDQEAWLEKWCGSL